MVGFGRVAKTSKAFIIGIVAFGALIGAGAYAVTQPLAAQAASCDKVNIIYCGISGSTTAEKVKNLQAAVTKNSDNGHTDIQQVMRWAGAGSVDIKTFSTDNTKLGTLYRNGTVKVDGKTVATDAWVTARFTEGSGFVKVKDGVWARKTTTSFKNASVPAFVHYAGDGSVDFVVMVDCGNAVKVTPVKPTPTPPAPTPIPTPPTPTPIPPTPAPYKALSCDNLVKATTGDARTFRLTATATPTNTTIQNYVFKYNDTTSKTVTTAGRSASDSHAFAEYATTYTATVYVNSADFKNVSGPQCVVQITTPAAPVTPTVACVGIGLSKVEGQTNEYAFAVEATKSPTATISGYTFYFGDGTSTPIATSDTKATTTHTYASNHGTLTAYVTVTSPQVSKPTTSDACKVTIPAVKPPTPITPVVTPPTPVAPQPIVENPVETASVEDMPVASLPSTGPGAVAGLFAGTSALGAVSHQIIRRRKNRSL